VKNWIVNNFWIKITSLVLAVITWFYVNGEVGKDKHISRSFYNSSRMEPTQRQTFPEKKNVKKNYQKRK